MELKIFDYDYYEQDLSAKAIETKFTQLLNEFNGIWLYREPEIKTEGDDLPTYTILSPQLGLIFVKSYLYNSESLLSVDNKFWTIDGQKVRSEFLRFRNYTHKIKSKIDDPILEISNPDSIPIRTIYILPYITNHSLFDNIALKENEKLFINNFSNISLEPLDEALENQDYNILVSIVQNANIINKISNLYVDEPAQNMSEAIILNNKKIAQFDYDQMQASLTITDKSERIRGLAGSGKTVLLAMKAAKLHKRFPNKKIAFVFFTKSLYYQATSLIRKYYNQIADDEPNWENLIVLHSWGGATTGVGFYSHICKENGIVPKTLRQMQFDEACKELTGIKTLKESFDYILIDEAQDFPLEFFVLVEKVAKSPKKVVIAYDELQTTNDITIPEFETLFGSTNGVPNIPLEAQYDYMLKKSYRNTLDVLVTAFSFGFGFYNNITQIIQDETTWHALGFETEGYLRPGEKITVIRPKENSPNSILDIYPKEHALHSIVCNDDDEVSIKITEQIKHLINNEHVKPTDIMVIDIKMNRSKILNAIQYQLLENEIDSHIPGVVSDSRDFFKDGKVTLSTPRNAKGNEVPIVLVVGCEDIYDKQSKTAQRQARNFMFISITRSKGWVYLYAAGRIKTAFENELKQITKNIPNMVFDFPDEDKLQELAKIDFITNNPKAKALDIDVSKFKKAIKDNDIALVKALLDLDPEFKKSLKDLVGE